MPGCARLTIRADTDPRDDAIARAASAHGIDLPGPVVVSDVVLLDADLDDTDRERLGAFLADPLLQTATWADPPRDDHAYEIALHPGVTDAAAGALVRVAGQLGIGVRAAAGARRIELPAGLPADAVDTLLRRVLANPVIERWATSTIEPRFSPAASSDVLAESVPLRHLDAAGLGALNAARAMALDPAELVAIQEHFRAEGRDPTDVELETLAQTWSEHCAHKTFRARITLDDASELVPLMRQLRDATDAIAAPFVRSAFVGNAGIVSFVDGVALALKAETHNHPSAVEPFGGANTGVGGVIRDVMGAGHRPLAITDVLCFGPSDVDAADVPAGALHPRRIREGVIAGVADYGNKIGLPTIAGAVLYDPAFTTNPLVFCGCVGTAPDEPAPTGPYVGDHVLLLGGATGRDGIRGATFSSLSMDASTGEVAGASVQIGDPITEKLLIDALADVDGLWTAITDCGAGGLSSAIGEMAEQLGADIELERVPLKYPGLAPWEIWLSEAQERMVVAVAPSDLDAFRAACARHRVDVTDVGVVTGSRRLVVRHRGVPVVDLPTSFLHDGRPQRTLTAAAPEPVRQPAGRHVDDPAATLLALLAHPNIASKAAVVHRYDHEIGGATLVRPLLGEGDRGHGDGVVIAAPGDDHGIAVGIGVNPWYGLHDPEAMAAAVVDEAIRNVVAVGADPERVALLDNFSWGDPRDAATLGELAAAVAGCCRAAIANRAPFVSGKDSLNNTYVGGEGARHAVPPTLVITAIAHVPDVEACVTAELRSPGNVLLLVGRTGEHFAGSHLDLVRGAHRAPSPAAGVTPQPDPDAPARYRRLHAAIRAGLVASCHDVSEGGLAVTVAEQCIASGFGASLDHTGHPDLTTGLFAESSGRFVVEVAPDDVDAFSALVGDATVLGSVTADPVLRIAGALAVDVSTLTRAFHS